MIMLLTFLLLLFFHKIFVVVGLKTNITSSITDIDQWASNINCTDGELLSPSICLPKNYDKRVPPMNTTEVFVIYNFGNFREVNDKKMIIVFDVVIDNMWRDDRILTPFASGGESIYRRDLYTIWTPRVYIENLKSYRQRSSNDQLKFEQLLVFNDKNVSQDVGLEHDEESTIVNHRFEAQIELYCPFSFDSYPMDVQVCTFKMGSPDLNKEKQVIFKIPQNLDFKESDCFMLDTYTSPKGNALQDFEIEMECFQAPGSPRTLRPFLGFINDSVAVNITLKRILRPFVMKYYLPCIAIVLSSEISFLIPITAMPARTALLATLFLSLINLFTSQQVKFYANKMHKLIRIFTMSSFSKQNLIYSICF